MSRGQECYYKLIGRDNERVTYGYSGAITHKMPKGEKLLEYEGIIEISISALKDKTLTEALTDGEVKIIKEGRFEHHMPRIQNGDITYGYFAIEVIYKILYEYKRDQRIAETGGVMK